MQIRIKDIIKAKEECESKIDGIEVALSMESDKPISITKTQAFTLLNLLRGYKKLLDSILNGAEVNI